jgi:hypothetical protein
MATMKRANVILNVNEAEVQYYMDLGFNQIDDTGNVIKESIPNDLNTLKMAYTEHVNKIAELEQEITDLKNAKKRSKTVKSE